MVLAPDHAVAQRLRDDARAAIARFDDAIADANRALAKADLDAATRSVNVARALDPASPVVADLSSRLVDSFRSQIGAARRTNAEPSQADRNEALRAQAARRLPAAAPESVAPPRSATAVSPPPAPVSIVAAVPSPASAAIAPAAAPSPSVDTSPVAPIPSTAPAPRADAVPERRPPAAAPSVEDDDAAIRRVVASYARAIESKDLALFRSVKPNLTPEEQRRLEEGFRAVTSQRVALTIDAIEHRGQDAVVRVRRHDTIQVGGRQQAADSQQTMTLTRAGAAWVIREIGR